VVAAGGGRADLLAHVHATLSHLGADLNGDGDLDRLDDVDANLERILRMNFYGDQ
jgi:hypothetical protein